MNIAAFVLALTGALLSLFQPVITIPLVNVSINLFGYLSYPGLDFLDRVFGFFVLVIAIIGAICGLNALKRKNLDGSSAGLILCGIIWVLLFFFSLFSVITHWVYLLWALFYFAAAVCASGNAQEDQQNEQHASSASTSFTSGLSRQNKNSYEPLIGIETTALIKRGKIFLDDSEFAEAERYFEQALKQDPENPHAYLGKLMAQLGVHNLKKLSTVPSPLSEQKLFKRAVDFADEKGKAVLMKCLKANDAHLEHIRLMQAEEKYQEAINTRNSAENNNYRAAIKSLQFAQKLFEELEGYKDSASLAETVRENIIRLEAENAEKVAAKNIERAARQAVAKAKFKEFTDKIKSTDFEYLIILGGILCLLLIYLTLTR